jgi:hypothetical protein
VLLACLLAALPVARADVILDWNALMIDIIRADNMSPPGATRSLAILHTAIWDAVNSVTRTHQPYAFLLDTPTNTSAEAAAVGAAYEVIVRLHPSFDAWAVDLYEQWLATIQIKQTLTNGLDLGAEIAQRMLDLRADDGANTEVPYIPSNAPGQWQRTPPFFRPPLAPHWGFVEPFGLPDLGAFMPGPPPALDSAEYATALNEVKSLGAQNSAARTAEQSQIAVFWSDFSYTATPPGHWQEIAATIASNRNLALTENARLFALLSIAQADAAILCWEAKYRYNFWRPVTAVRRAVEDGNAATEPDANWNSFLAAPPFPAYTSGHSTFSKASAQVLAHFFGTDAVTFTATSDSLAGVVRSFTSLSDCVNEIGRSRIYGGIHFEFDNREGKASGARIGDYVSANFLLPNARLPEVRIGAVTKGIPQLTVHAHVGATFVLEATSDLNQWQPNSTNVAVSGGVILRDLGAPGSNMRFYRAVEQP